MAHELHHDDGFHEIQLSGKQLVFLFMATTVVSIVIFLCGVLVGRGVQNARGSIVSAAGLDSADAKSGDEEVASAPATGEPTPVAGLSYPRSLPASEGTPAPVEPGAAAGIAPTPEVSAPVRASEPESPTPATAVKEATKALPKDDAPKEAQKEAPKEAPKAAVPAAVPASASTAPAPAEDGGFTVQVTALKNRPEADAIAQRLQGRGYQAYVVAPSAGGQVIYKVRVGVNLQRQEADKVMRRLQNEEKFKPWITR
jgi:cell division septation protein DedD